MEFADMKFNEKLDAQEVGGEFVFFMQRN